MKYFSKKDLKKALPKREKRSHKGDNGKLLICTGSYDYPGAAVLAAASAEAAFRAGNDLVFVAAPEPVAYAVNYLLPDVITIKLKGKYLAKKHAKTVLRMGKIMDAIVCGPGVGARAETKSFVLELTQKVKVPLVLDADALKAAAGKKFNGKVIVTPHSKEFEIMFKKKITGKSLNEKARLVKKFAKEKKCIILLKGFVDIISDGKKLVFNRTGNPGMTVAGTGDVLAGLCGAFAAMKMGLFDAACCAAFVNGKAGELVAKEKGYGLMAHDLVEKIPKIIWK